MGESRLLRPIVPGGLLSPNAGQEFTPSEELVVQSIVAGTYFVENEAPTDTGDHQNFTLAHAPNPAASLQAYKNGARIKGGGVDYTMTTTTNLQLINPLDDPASEIVTVDYRFSPV